MQISVFHDKANTLHIEFKGFMNPRTLKQTASFTMITRDKNGLIDNMGSPIFFVKMTTLALLSDMSVKAGNITNGAFTPYIITFVTPINLQNGD